MKRLAILIIVFVAEMFLASTLYAQITPFSVSTTLLSEEDLEELKTIVAEEAMTNKNVKKASDEYPIEGMIANCSALRIRTWPWGMVGGSYPPGTKLTITGESGEFYAVNVNGKAGYMHKNYINTAKLPASGVAPYYPGTTLNGGYLPQEEGENISDFAASETSNTPNLRESLSSNVSQSQKKYTSTVYAKAPTAKVQSMPDGKTVNSNSSNFDSWVADAVAKHSSSWGFPNNIVNKYNETITPKDYLMSIMTIESSGVHNNANGKITTSGCGALGFMQLMPRTASSMGINPANPAQNILGGAKYFGEIFNSKNLKNKTGVDRIVMGACAYNMGPYSSKLGENWSGFKKSGISVQSYGIKLKMCLGLELTADERNYVANKMGRKDVDAYATECYAQRKGLE